MQNGGRLARVRSEWENVGVYSACQAQQCWTALSDARQEGWWEWQGYNNNELEFSNWKTGMPGNALPQRCPVHLLHTAECGGGQGAAIWRTAAASMAPTMPSRTTAPSGRTRQPCMAPICSCVS